MYPTLSHLKVGTITNQLYKEQKIQTFFLPKITYQPIIIMRINLLARNKSKEVQY